MAYFQDIKRGIQTSITGLGLTLRHLRNATKRRSAVGVASDNYFELQTGLVTLEYPHEQLPIPDNGRYRLHNEIDDCIVCDKCAKVCPVDCITIDAIKATEEVGRASDGSPIRLYAATFDIDMAKCCYCGLCTVVCPTECLTMDKKFDYSEFDLDKLTYHYADLTPAEADEKRALYEQFVQEKEAQKAAAAAAKKAATPAEAPATPAKRPAFRPTAKPATPVAPDENSAGGAIEHPLTDATPTEMEQIAQGGLETTKKPTFQPTRKPTVLLAPIEPDAQANVAEGEKAMPAPSAPKPAFRPSMKPASTTPPADAPSLTDDTAASPSEPAKPKPAFRPTMKPPTSPAPASESANEPKTDALPEVPKPKPAFRPTMKPALSAEPAAKPVDEADKSNGPVEKKAAFRPTMKPKPSGDAPDDAALSRSETPSTDDVQPQPNAPAVPKPAGFRPTMKPAVPPTATPNEQAAPETNTEPSAEASKPKPAFRPTMKPTITSVPTATDATESANEKSADEPPKAKPAFRPTMKPKPKPDEGESA